MAVKMVVVDDDEVFIAKAKNFTFDAEIITFSDPGLALEKMASINPDITITDVMMPGVHGFRFMSIAKDIIKSINLIVISANTKEQVEKDFGSLGRTTFFRKPLDEGFYSYVDSLIDRLKNEPQTLSRESPISYLAHWIRLDRLAILFKNQQDFLYKMALQHKNVMNLDYQEERESLSNAVDTGLTVLVGDDQAKRNQIIKNLSSEYPTWQAQVLANIDKFIVPKKTKCEKNFLIGIRVPKGEYAFKGEVDCYEVALDRENFPILKINDVTLTLDPDYVVEPHLGVAGAIVLTSRYLEWLDRCLNEALTKK